MIRLMEITGLTLSDMSEITAFVLFLLMLGVCAGNIFSWLLKGLFESFENLVDALLAFIKEHIVDRWKRNR